MEVRSAAAVFLISLASACSSDASSAAADSAVNDSLAAGCCSARDSSCEIKCELPFTDEYIAPNIWGDVVTSTFCNERTRHCEVMSEHCINGWCLVPAGSFRAGSTVYVDLPVMTPAPHTAVATRSFWIQATEATNAQWLEVMDATLSPSALRACGDDCPVADINVFDIAEFANRLSQRDDLSVCYELVNCTAPDALTGAKRLCDALKFDDPDCDGYRLPTDIEWELASRAGSSGCWHNGEGSYDYSPQCIQQSEPPLYKHGWWCANSQVSYEGCEDMSDLGHDATDCMGVHPVAQLPPNRLGLYDVAGNVMETTGTLLDPQDPGPTEGSVVVDSGHAAVVTAADATRTMGGNFANGAGGTCAYSGGPSGVIQHKDFGFSGFRLVRTATD